jgi:hypothetical protein
MKESGATMKIHWNRGDIWTKYDDEDIETIRLTLYANAQQVRLT